MRLTRDAVRRVLAGAATAACATALVLLAGCQAAPPTPDVPAGSLWLLAEAAEKGDWGTMLVYMDPVQVGGRFAEATVARLESNGEAQSSDADSGTHGGSFTPGPMVTGFTDAFVTNLQANTKNGVLLGEGNLMQVILDGGLGETEYVADDEALVDVELTAQGGEVSTVRLRMVRDAEHWKLIALEDTTDLYEALF